MTDEIELVKALIKKAADAHDSNDALKFSQGACNAANALAVLAHMQQQLEPQP